MIKIEITEEEYGQRGGTYYFIEKEDGTFIRVSDTGLKIDEVRSGRGYQRTYEIRLPENKTVYSFDFSSSGRNRNLSVFLYNPVDFLYDRYPKPIQSYYDSNEIYERFLDKFQLSIDTKNAVLEYKNLQPLIKNLVDMSPNEWLNAPPATEDAILRPSYYLATAYAMSKYGSVPRSLTNIIKYFKQLYEIKAIVDGFDAKVEKLDLSRRGSYFPYHAPNLDTLPLGVLEILQITFSNPNFIIQTEDDFYTIWYEFSLTRDIRPDFFILKRKHETPFEKGVYDFLSSMDKDFGRRIIEQWRSGFLRAFGKDVPADVPSKKDVEEFLIGLAKFLKKGLIIESKENIDDFRTKTTQRQLITYPKIFSDQSLLLLSWVTTPPNIQGFDIIDNFNIDVESTRRFTNYMKEVFG